MWLNGTNVLSRGTAGTLADLAIQLEEKLGRGQADSAELSLLVDLYTQVGLILMIALASKNAILIVEFARELQRQGMSLTEAAVEATRRRFRPIIMTSLAFILGVLPLVLSTGAGAGGGLAYDAGGTPPPVTVVAQSGSSPTIERTLSLVPLPSGRRSRS